MGQRTEAPPANRAFDLGHLAQGWAQLLSQARKEGWEVQPWVDSQRVELLEAHYDSNGDGVNAKLFYFTGGAWPGWKVPAGEMWVLDQAYGAVHTTLGGQVELTHYSQKMGFYGPIARYVAGAAELMALPMSALPSRAVVLREGDGVWITFGVLGGIVPALGDICEAWIRVARFSEAQFPRGPGG
jgi:hypothetical protein